MRIRVTSSLAILGLVLAMSGGVVALAGPVSASTSARTELFSCNGKDVYKPSSFIISCADANSELTATHWTSWTASAARGSTTFGLNLCTPNCAASRITFFKNSSVKLASPQKTRHGSLFSKLVVTYTLRGKVKTFSFDWSGDPGF